MFLNFMGFLPGDDLKSLPVSHFLEGGRVLADEVVIAGIVVVVHFNLFQTFKTIKKHKLTVQPISK
jgi:hypothetical protein